MRRPAQEAEDYPEPTGAELQAERDLYEQQWQDHQIEQQLERVRQSGMRVTDGEEWAA